MKKTKLSIIGTRGYPYVYSGYETFVKELSERIKDEFEVTVYCHRNLFSKRPKSVNGIKLVYTPSLNSKYFSQIFNSFFSFVHVCFSKSDVVLVVNTANGFFGILTKIFRKKTVINVDGMEWLRPKWNWIAKYFFFISSKIATIFYDEIITDADEMRKIYKEKFNRDSHVIAYGSEIKKSSDFGLISKYGLKKLEYYLIVGRLIPDNNIDFIISEFINSSTIKKLVIVGDVPYKDKFATRIKNINDSRLVFTGYIINQSLLSALYQNCYVYIHGHEYGGTNPTLIKALASSTSIIALNTNFNREMLQDFSFGKPFEKEINSLKNLINYCDQNQMEMKRSRENSINGITKKYDWNEISKKYSKVFYNLV